MNISDALIWSRFDGAPLLVAPDLAWGFVEAIKSGLVDAGKSEQDSPYVVKNGVATIPVFGYLTNKGIRFDGTFGVTSFVWLAQTMRQASSDPRVRTILLDVDSPGGEAAGAMETADVVRSVAARKKTVAFVNGLGASAAYAIAAAASEIVVAPSANVGSIGVVVLHQDLSAAYAKRGVKPSLIHAGKYKVDGHALGPLAPDVKARIQTAIDDVYTLFTSSVGKHRPKLGPAGARKTEGALYMGAKAVAASLADRVGTLDDAAASLNIPFSLNLPSPRSEVPMSGHPIATPAAPAPTLPDREANSDAVWSEIAATFNAKLPSWARPEASPWEAAARAMGAASSSPPGSSGGRASKTKSRAPISAERQAAIDAEWTAVAAELNATLPTGARGAR